MSNRLTRRQFIGTTIAAGSALAFSPNEKLQYAAVGVGGMGGADSGSISTHKGVEVVACCDIEDRRLAAARKKWPKAKIFTDFRKMFDTMGKDIDAVSVSTPDHMHAPVAMTAIQNGKHVYCQKPLTHDVYEARRLRLAAKEKGVVTQMGIQIHSHAAYRTAVKAIHDGVIGKVKEVHSWSDKAWGTSKGRPEGEDPVPAGLHWENWLGTAPHRPYKKGAYHPGNWRRWFDFGCGTMGDMAIHIVDPVAGALELTTPTELISDSPKPYKEAFGMRNRVRYTFPGTKHTADTVKVTWYDGSFRPETAEWPVKKIPSQGSLFMGEKGAMLLPHIGAPKLFPEADFAGTKIEAVPGGNHWHLWVDACLGNGKTSAGFDYAGPLTEWVLLGVVANRFPKRQLKWDAEALKFTNDDEPNSLIRRTYRKGWEVDGL